MDKLLGATGLIGDVRATNLYAIPLPSVNWAEAVTDELVARFRPDLDVTVRYAPRRPAGLALIDWGHGGFGKVMGQRIPHPYGCRIDLYPGGRDMGTLAHELAHAVGGSGHGSGFRLAHSWILDLLEQRLDNGTAVRVGADKGQLWMRRQ